MSDQADLDVIERRCGSVRAVRQVVHAIWALARSQLPLAERAAAEASVYLDWVDQVVARIAGEPLPFPARDTLTVVVGPERPYCGGLPRRVLQQIPGEGRLGLAGARLVETARELPEIWGRTLFTTASSTSHDDHEDVGRALALAVLEHGRGAQIDLLHPVRDQVELRRVVLLAGRRAPAPTPPETYGALADVLDRAVTEALSSRLAVGAAETLRAELSARMTAADRARTACDRRLEELGAAWRAARQERITGELLEVVLGAEVAAEAARAGR